MSLSTLHNQIKVVIYNRFQTSDVKQESIYQPMKPDEI